MNSTVKPFKTIDEQIKILQSHNVIIDDIHEAEEFLMNESYYAVINGYKDPFIDKEKARNSGHAFFKNGTRFDDFKSLFIFDRELRKLTLSVLMQAETIMKNATVYAFCYYNREHDAYLYPESYCSSNDYKPRKNYTRNLIRLLNTLQMAHDNKQNKKYIEHYIETYRCVPLWVIAKTLTFGNMASFYDLQSVWVQNATCNNIGKIAKKKKEKLGIKEVRKAYRILSGFRNICAHGERLYCARIGHDNYAFADMLKHLSLIIPDNALFDYARSVIGLVASVSVSKTVEKAVFEGLALDRETLTAYLSSAPHNNLTSTRA